MLSDHANPDITFDKTEEEEESTSSSDYVNPMDIEYTGVRCNELTSLMYKIRELFDTMKYNPDTDTITPPEIDSEMWRNMIKTMKPTPGLNAVTTTTVEYIMHSTQLKREDKDKLATGLVGFTCCKLDGTMISARVCSIIDTVVSNTILNVRLAIDYLRWIFNDIRVVATNPELRDSKQFTDVTTLRSYDLSNYIDDIEMWIRIGFKYIENGYSNRPLECYSYMRKYDDILRSMKYILWYMKCLEGDEESIKKGFFGGEELYIYNDDINWAKYATHRDAIEASLANLNDRNTSILNDAEFVELRMAQYDVF